MNPGIFGLLFFAFAVISCTSRNIAKVPTLRVDLDATVHLDVSQMHGKTVWLDSTCLIGRIGQVCIADTVALVKSSEILAGFDLRTGDLVARYSRKGRASGEYLSIWSIGIDEEMVYLYDINSKKVMYFDISGHLLKQVPVAQSPSEKPFQDFVRRGDGAIIGKRVFGAGEIPELSLYDSDFRHVSDIDGFILRSGSYFGCPFFRNMQGDVYYVRSMLNDIYVLKGTFAEKAYSVDFGNSTIPFLERFKDEMEIISYANKFPDRYATFISNIYDSDDYVCFMFLAKRKKMYAVYEKSSGHTFSFDFCNGNGVLSQIVTHDDSVYLFWESETGSIEVAVLSVQGLFNASVGYS